MKRALVIGYGISGKGAEKLLLKLGYEVAIAEQTVKVPAGDFEFAVLSGTLTVNLVGSLVIGILMGLLSSQANFSEKTYLLLVVGILGGFTTFSSYSFENLELLQQGMYRNFVLYLLISNIGGILLAFLGYKLALNSINI